MKRISIAIIILLIINCISYENATVYDEGKKEIGDNLYLKKLIIKSDYIYLLVDSTDNLVSTSVNTVQPNRKTKR